MLRSIHSNEIFTIAILIGLFCVTLAKLLAPKRFEDFLLIIGNSKYLKIYHREPKLLDQFDALLFANLTIGLSTLGYIIYRHVFTITENNFNLMLTLVFSIGIFIIIKMFIERVTSSIFEMDKLIDQYLFQKTTYKNFLGLVLIPANGILLYNYTNSTLLLIVIIGLLGIINLIGFISTVKTFQGVIIPNLFYFILYICALEIAPYIILYKVVIS